MNKYKNEKNKRRSVRHVKIENCNHSTEKHTFSFAHTHTNIHTDEQADFALS